MRSRIQECLDLLAAPFRELGPARQVTRTATMVAVTVALGCTAALVLAARASGVRAGLEDLRRLARVLAVVSSDAVAAGDAGRGARALEEIGTRPGVVAALLLGPDGSVLARYVAPGHGLHVPALVPEGEQASTAGGRAVVFAPVRQGDRIVGTVYVMARSGEVPGTGVLLAVGTVCVVLAGAGTLALRGRLARDVGGPLVELDDLLRPALEGDPEPALLAGRGELGPMAQRIRRILGRLEAAERTAAAAGAELATRVQTGTGELEQEAKLRRLAEVELEARTEDLARANLELERFAWVTHHELQEPLRAISGFAQILARRYEGRFDEKADGYIRNIVEGIDRMRALIGGLREYWQVVRESRAFDAVDMRSVLERVLRKLEPAIRESGAEIEIQSDLPELRVDADQMVELFGHLLDNAIRFTEEQPHIGISARREDHAWRFSVKDNGIGLEKEFAEQIFVLFQRLHARQERAGVGVGLALCRRIVERHGGRIWVESEPGEGSTFHFTIPDSVEGRA